MALLSWYRAPYALTPVVIVVVWLPGSFDVWTHDSVQDPFQVLPGAPLCVCVCVYVCISVSLFAGVIQYNGMIWYLLHIACVYVYLCECVCLYRCKRVCQGRVLPAAVNVDFVCVCV